MQSKLKSIMEEQWILSGLWMDLMEKSILFRPGLKLLKVDKVLRKLSAINLLETSQILIEGRAIGQKIGTGKTRIINDLSEMESCQQG